MNKLAIKILLHIGIFSIISLGLSSIIYSFDVDYVDYHRNTIIEQKIDSLANNKYNVVALGSSVTYRHFDPIIFDSINPHCFSFNAGLPAIRPFRSFDYVKSAVNSNDKKYDLILLELTDLDMLITNFDKATFKYSMDFERYKIALQYPFKLKSSYTYTLYYTKLILHKYMGFNLSNHIMLLMNIDPFENSTAPFLMPVENSIRGYRSANSMMSDSNQKIKEYYSGLNREFMNSELNNTKNIFKFYDNMHKKATIINNNNLFYNYYIKFLNEISEKTKNLILIIPPRGSYSVRLLSLKNKLLENDFKVWDYSNPNEYPELYTSELSFDLFHLNGIGADLYTTKLANRYNVLINQKVTD